MLSLARSLATQWVKRTPVNGDANASRWNSYPALTGAAGCEYAGDRVTTGALNLASLDFFGAALETGARAEQLVAANIANADTPGYKSRAVDFDQALAARLEGATPVAAQYVRGLPTGLDGNDVSLDYESVQSAANSQRMRASLAFAQRDVETVLTALQPQGPSNLG